MGFLFNVISIPLLLSVMVTSFSIAPIRKEMTEGKATLNVVQNTVEGSLHQKVYISDDNLGYNNPNSTTDLLFSPLTSLAVQTTPSDSNIIITNDYYPSVLVDNASNVSFAINFSNITSGSAINNTWSLSNDSYGSTQGDSVPYVHINGQSFTTGEIASGAIVVQTSLDGKNYHNIEKGKYASGLYTTNAFNNYHGKKQIIYTPDGDMVKKGIHISISILYEVYKVDRIEYVYSTWQQVAMYTSVIGMIVELAKGPQEKVTYYQYKNIRETYSFFLSEDSVDSITFNNITNDINEETRIKDKEGNDSLSIQDSQSSFEKISKISETLVDGSVTTNGFKINITNNPHIGINILKNGEVFNPPKLEEDENGSFYKIVEQGKYDITLNSRSKEKKLSIYVDRRNTNERFVDYFGEPIMFEGNEYGNQFLDYSIYGKNKRMLDPDSDVPVFANSVSFGTINKIDNLPVLYGFVTNKITGEKHIVEDGYLLSTYGSYEVYLFNNYNYFAYCYGTEPDAVLAGDMVTFIYRFAIKHESNRTTINKEIFSQKSYEGYEMATYMDYYPEYYAVSVQTINKGRVLVAFASSEAAKDYARERVVSDIEGPFYDKNNRRYYKVPSLKNYNMKEDEYSPWDLAKKIEELADNLVSRQFFDSTNSNSLITIDTTIEDVDGNIEELELDLQNLGQTIVVWASKEEKLKSIEKAKSDDALACIGKSYLIKLLKNENVYSEVSITPVEQMFIKDYLGLNTHIIIATDSDDFMHLLQYDRDIVEQFVEKGVKPGIVKITEFTIYEDPVQYSICFLGVDITVGELVMEGEQNDDGSYTGKVTITDVTNYIDTCLFAKVFYYNNYSIDIEYYTLEELKELSFDKPGEYVIQMIDRAGNSSEIEFTVIGYEEGF